MNQGEVIPGQTEFYGTLESDIKGLILACWDGARLNED